MANKMNLNVVAKTDEEKRIEAFLNLLHKSEEIKNFLNLMEEEAKKRDVFKFRCRVKNVDSAIRTHRINKKGLDEVRDYVGISFITKDEKSIYPIIEFLKTKLPNGDYVDFVAEEMIYSPLVYTKWVPPLGYNILAKEKLIPNEMEVPIEIRVCSKEAYISEQSAYYSVQKNDTTNLPMQIKNNLRNLVQHITYKLALLNTRELCSEEREQHEKELMDIIEKNKEFLKENNLLVKDAVLDFGKLVYKCEKDKEISEINLSSQYTEKIDEKIKNIFENLLDETDGKLVDKVNKSLEKLLKCQYEDFINAIKDE